MADTIWVINGPNLNLLGEREPEIYGHDGLAGLKARCEKAAAAHGVSLRFEQSNHEGEIIDWLHAARISARGIILNAGGYTHTSVAIHDALKTLKVPLIEVHLSNIFAREEFRHHSYISPLARGVICGLGARGYELAIAALVDG